MSQIINKFLADNSVTDAKIASGTISSAKLAGSVDATKIADGSVSNAEFQRLDGVTSSIQTQIDSKVAKAGDTMSGNLAMGGNKVTGLGAPSASGDAATKGYVDSVAEGLKPKAAVRVATAVAGTLASSFENGDTVDGIVLATGNRILLKDQAAPEENGIYTVNASGAPTRATDFDSLSPIDEINGAMVAVQEGTANAGKVFVQYGTVATLGTDPITFVFFNSSASLVGGDGITVSGSNISVDHDGEGLQIVSTQLALELDGSTLSKSATGLKVASGGITNTEVNASAAIAYSKLNLSGSIVNADVNASAAIAYSKLAALTASRVLVSDGSGFVSASSVTSTTLAFLDATSSIQTQLDGKASTTLNNLSASTAFNQDIKPQDDGVQNLGSTANRINNIYAVRIRDSGGIVVLNAASRELINATGTAVLDFNGANLDFLAKRLINIANPTGAQDAATKAYVDALPAAAINNKETFTLGAGDITNQYIDFAQVAKTNSVHLIIKGGAPTLEGASHDYSLSYTGGVGGKTRLTFLNDLATGGAAALIAGDILQVAYSY